MSAVTATRRNPTGKSAPGKSTKGTMAKGAKATGAKSSSTKSSATKTKGAAGTRASSRGVAGTKDGTRTRGRNVTAGRGAAGNVTNQAYADVLVAALLGKLHAAAAGGQALTAVLGDPEALAARVAAVVPAPSPWAATIGPVYRQASLAEARGHSRQAVSDLVKKRRILALTTSDGHVVIPAFQLDSALRPLRGIAEILQILTPDVVDEWTLASWLTTHHESLGASSVIDHLAAGGDLEPVVAVATAARHRWAA